MDVINLCNSIAVVTNVGMLVLCNSIAVVTNVGMPVLSCELNHFFLSSADCGNIFWPTAL
jgi:hypothetical protein